MDKRKIAVTVVCEDDQQESFIKKYLIKIGILEKKIRIKQCQYGSGEQFVREQIVKEIKAYRNPALPRHQLVAIIDGDRMSVEDRNKQIGGEIKKEGLESIRADEKIFLLIPKRNIETWTFFLISGEAVDESMDYPKSKSPGKNARIAAEILFAFRNNNWSIPDICPPSLRAAIEQFKRIGT